MRPATTQDANHRQARYTLVREPRLSLNSAGTCREAIWTGLTGRADGLPYQPPFGDSRADCYMGFNAVQVHVVDHPAAADGNHARDERTDNAGFQAALRELTLPLILGPPRAPCEPVPDPYAPLAETVGSRLASRPCWFLCLRAGLG